jgi:altronate dehydratase
MSADVLPLDAACRLPAPGDNVAIAIRRLDVGVRIAFADGARALAHTVLEGHRFAVRRILRGEPLLSWGLPFGVALVDIDAGEYVCNQSMLAALAVRDLDAAVVLPPRANFADRLEPFRFDESKFRAGCATERVPEPRTFLGYRRPGGRGVGTRNYIVVLATTSRTASFARQLAARLQPLARVYPSFDGVVAVAHTEGGGPGEPNNTAEILRALAGFMVHPNVGAVLAVDYGIEPVTNARLATFMREGGYPLADVAHQFLTLDHGLAAGLADGEAIIRAWLPVIAAQTRTPGPLSGLRIALQCGGSDAFSGVSGNPLAGAIVHEVIRNGGTGVLTETDEAIGGEDYLLRNIRDAATAHALLGKIESFRERLRWHGVTPESNPSAGNKFRGLYNITLKSLGAVHKKDPRTRIDFVCDYADPLEDPGFYFMNGPGNDLEGVAGQIAAGCNLVLFVTGNGSITNFPFVPTLKITTTTRRHQLLIHEMDINAGRYLDGEPMDALVADAVNTVVTTASGQRTKGERAGHSQVSIWRNWRQTDASQVTELKARPEPNSHPLPIADPGTPVTVAPSVSNPASALARLPLHLFKTASGFAPERVGLVLPTSLCSAQIARLAAERLNAKQLGREQGISRFVALAHTEGCGFGGESMYHLLYRTYRGYLTHPNVAAALLLEHGCEKVPNDVMRRQLENAGIPLARFGWASVQLDGGISNALDKVEAWFASKLGDLPPAQEISAGFGALNVALMTAAAVTEPTALALARVARALVVGGGSVFMPESDPLLASRPFRAALFGGTPPHATLAYGQPAVHRGFHVVATETDHWVENVTGLGACGAQLALTVVKGRPEQGHPLVAVIQSAEPDQRGVVPGDDIDLFLTGHPVTDADALLAFAAAVAQNQRVPAAAANGFVDFQLTRGLLGVTT